MQDPTLADAILDRLVHNVYKFELKGESMRRKRSLLDQKTETVAGVKNTLRDALSALDGITGTVAAFTGIRTETSKTWHIFFTGNEERFFSMN
jgi:hypothetical protein